MKGGVPRTLSSSSSSSPSFPSHPSYGTMSPRVSVTQDPEGDAHKNGTENIEVAEDVANGNRPNPRKEAPVYVAALSPDERARAERALVRKIDIRLLPMIIIMYIMNYLDRNNIVSWPRSTDGLPAHSS